MVAGIESPLALAKTGRIRYNCKAWEQERITGSSGLNWPARPVAFYLISKHARPFELQFRGFRALPNNVGGESCTVTAGEGE